MHNHEEKRMMRGARRFIAGATCPACGAFDKLFVTTDDEQTSCECVACGFRDSRQNDVVPGSAEYMRGLGQLPEGVQPVRLVDPH